MPTYDYKCEECSGAFETTHGINDTVESCPGCGGKVRRLFHPVGIIFKGSGFYKTDSRSAFKNGDGTASPEKVGEGLEKAEEKDTGKKEKPKADSKVGD